MVERHQTDFLTGAGLFAASLLIFFYLIPTFVSGGTHTELSPRFFPRIATVLLGLLSFLMMTKSVRAIKKEHGRTSLRDLVPHQWSCSLTWPTIITVLCLGVYFLLFEHLGFLIATPPVVAVMMWFFGQRRPLRIALISLILTGVIYTLFTYGLKVPLG
jgi:hypothetical protein